MITVKKMGSHNLHGVVYPPITYKVADETPSLITTEDAAYVNSQKHKQKSKRNLKQQQKIKTEMITAVAFG